MLNLSRSELVLLRAIQAHAGEWNWHQLGRATLGDLDSPADFSLKELRERGYIASVKIDGEPLERLHITEEGSRILAALENSPGGAIRE